VTQAYLTLSDVLASHEILAHEGRVLRAVRRDAR
jgi:hypothetical protein